MEKGNLNKTQTPLKFTIKRIQVVLFVRNLLSILEHSSLQFATEFVNVMSFLNSEPTVFPLPIDAPREIPRIVLKSNDEKYNCNISNSRIDFSMNNIRDLTIIKLWDELQPTIGLLSDFVKKKELQINRIGFIVISETETPDDGSKYLKDNFIKRGKLKDPRELKIRYVRRVKINEIDSNITASFGLIGSGVKLQPNRLFLQLDINTIPELMEKDEFNLTGGQVINFTNEAFDIAKRKIKFFPAI